MTEISAKSILASVSMETGKRIDTFELRYPRWIHAEFMTHRAFSRNAASSRAIPVKKMIEDIIREPAVPIFWGKNQKGMQAGEEHNELIEFGYEGPPMYTRERAWLNAIDDAITWARRFDKAGYHKQIVNRLLEPFMHIKVVVTATEWDNFFALRIHEAAEPHMRMLAEKIKEARDAAHVEEVGPWRWHLPYVNITDETGRSAALGREALRNAVRLSVARCASVSYQTVEGGDMTLEKANDICDKLFPKNGPPHLSPFEHQASPDETMVRENWACPEEWGNLVGWLQLRKTIETDRQFWENPR